MSAKIEGAVFVDFATQQGGFDRPDHGLEQTKCPKCGAATNWFPRKFREPSEANA